MDTERLKKVISQIKVEKENFQGKDNELGNTIENIRTAYIQDWESHYLEFIIKFLNQVSHGLPTPVLSVCGKGTQEIRYTKYLAYMLEETNSHGLKNILLKNLFVEPVKKYGLKNDWTSKCTVFSELLLGHYIENGNLIYCYCDIGIVGEDFLILIEQKILSSESMNEKTELGQLNRYSLCLENNPEYNKKKLVKFYLTPSGELPLEVNDWEPLSHMHVIEKGIGVLKSNELTNVAKENLKRFLMDLVIGPYQKTEENVRELINKSNDLRKGFNYYNAVRLKQLLDDNRLLIDVVMEGKVDD